MILLLLPLISPCDPGEPYRALWDIERFEIWARYQIEMHAQDPSVVQIYWDGDEMCIIDPYRSYPYKTDRTTYDWHGVSEGRFDPMSRHIPRMWVYRGSPAHPPTDPPTPRPDPKRYMHLKVTDRWTTNPY